MASALSEYSQVGVGIVVPYDFALDRELWRWAPAESTLHLTRLPVGPAAVTVEMVTKVGDSGHVRTAVGDLLQALELLGVDKVSIAAPYSTAITAGLRDFLVATGRQVVGFSELNLTQNIWTVPQRVTADLITAADAPDAQAIVVSCTNLATYELIAPLEAELGKPIVSANQATMWAALRMVGLAAVGDGQGLLATDLLHHCIAEPSELLNRVRRPT
ncbi:MAG: maleate cis-trans isomerase family protein [Nakamurella sp.]